MNKLSIKAEMDKRTYENTRAMIDHLMANVNDALSEAIYETLDEVAMESRIDYVPVRTGRLRSSIHATIPERTPDGQKGSVISTVYYAGYVHEKHKTKSKYIEIPFMSMFKSGMMQKRIARSMFNRMGFK